MFWWGVQRVTVRRTVPGETILTRDVPEQLSRQEVVEWRVLTEACRDLCSHSAAGTATLCLVESRWTEAEKQTQSFVDGGELVRGDRVKRPEHSAFVD